MAGIVSRFIMNLPNTELSSFERLFMQLEQAHWYYIDHWCDKYPKLPKMKLKDFCKYLFGHCDFLLPHKKRFDELYLRFRDYLGNVPVCGAILVNSSLSHLILVQSHKGTSWGFPKGKMNQNEASELCAAREVKEETGFDCSKLLKKNEFCAYKLRGKKQVKLYIVCNVPDDYPFAPETRKEIADIQWVPIQQIINAKQYRTADKKLKLWQVQPIVKQLKEWLNKKLGKHKNNKKDKMNKKKNRNNKQDSYRNVYHVDHEVETFDNMETFGNVSNDGWSVEDMFNTNQILYGVTQTTPYNQMGHNLDLNDDTLNNNRYNNDYYSKRSQNRNGKKSNSNFNETFGNENSRGWSFEDMMEANRKLTHSQSNTATPIKKSETNIRTRTPPPVLTNMSTYSTPIKPDDFFASLQDSSTPPVKLTNKQVGTDERIVSHSPLLDFSFNEDEVMKEFSLK